MKEEIKEFSLKFRPKTFDEFFGNNGTVTSLISLFSRPFNEIPRKYLFIGPPGCGKTTLTRIIKNILKCSNADFYDYNISQMRGIDTAKEIINNAYLYPINGNVKIFVLNECHKATVEFQNCMLDILEFPPKHVFFLLCTTEPEKLLKTIRGQRAHTYAVTPLPRNKIFKLLNKICIKEKANNITDNILFKIASVCDGSPRRALLILESIIYIQNSEEVLINSINEYSHDEREGIELCRALLKNSGWKEISKILKGIKQDPEVIRSIVNSYMSKVILDRMDVRAGIILRNFINKSFFYSKKPGLINTCYETQLDLIELASLTKED